MRNCVFIVIHARCILINWICRWSSCLYKNNTRTTKCIHSTTTTTRMWFCVVSMKFGSCISSSRTSITTSTNTRTTSYISISTITTTTTTTTKPSTIAIKSSKYTYPIFTYTTITRIVTSR